MHETEEIEANGVLLALELTLARPCRKLCSSWMCFQKASCVCSSSWHVWQTIQKLSPDRQNSPSFVQILLFLLRMRGKPIALTLLATPRDRALRFIIIIYMNVLLAGRNTGLHLTSYAFNGDISNVYISMLSGTLCRAHSVATYLQLISKGRQIIELNKEKHVLYIFQHFLFLNLFCLIRLQVHLVNFIFCWS